MKIWIRSGLKKKYLTKRGVSVFGLRHFQTYKENGSVHLVSIFIMLMFIIIEVAPTFFKMMVAAGPYDDLLRAEVIKKKAYADQAVAEATNELNTAIAISTKTNAEVVHATVIT